MKFLIALVTTLFVSLNSFALGGLHETGCTNEEVQIAERIVAKRNLLFEGGAATEITVLYAQGNLIDVKVCAEIIEKQDYCHKKARNLEEILRIKKAYVASGYEAEGEARFVQDQIATLRKDCNK